MTGTSCELGPCWVHNLLQSLANNLLNRQTSFVPVSAPSTIAFKFSGAAGFNIKRYYKRNLFNNWWIASMTTIELISCPLVSNNVPLGWFITDQHVLLQFQAPLVMFQSASCTYQDNENIVKWLYLRICLTCSCRLDTVRFWAEAPSQNLVWRINCFSQRLHCRWKFWTRHRQRIKSI